MTRTAPRLMAERRATIRAFRDGRRGHGAESRAAVTVGELASLLDDADELDAPTTAAREVAAKLDAHAMSGRIDPRALPSLAQVGMLAEMLRAGAGSPPPGASGVGGWARGDPD